MEATVHTKQDVLECLRRIAPDLTALGVKAIALFGSFLRDEARAESDVDLLVEFMSGRKTFDNYMQLGFRLEEALGRRVELVTKESLSPYVGSHVLGEAEYVSFNH